MGRIISGDHVLVDYRGCPCGRAGASVFPGSTRFASYGDDKITCAGTMDAYVRGFIDA